LRECAPIDHIDLMGAFKTIIYFEEIGEMHPNPLIAK